MDAYEGRRRSLRIAALLAAFLMASATVGYVGFFLEDATGAVMATEELRSAKPSRRRVAGGPLRPALPPVPPRDAARVAEEARVRFAGAAAGLGEEDAADLLLAAGSDYADAAFDGPLLLTTTPIVSHGAGSPGSAAGSGGGGIPFGEGGAYSQAPARQYWGDDGDGDPGITVAASPPADPLAPPDPPPSPTPAPEPSAPLLFAASSLLVARGLRRRRLPHRTSPRNT